MANNSLISECNVYKSGISANYADKSIQYHLCKVVILRNVHRMSLVHYTQLFRIHLKMLAVKKLKENI